MMVSRIDLTIDVTDALRESEGWQEEARIAVTVVLPDPATMPDQPILCFAKPGGGYSRGYYTEELPGPASGAQAAWHAERGWIFVAMDPPGTGGSSRHAADVLTFAAVARACLAAEEDIMLRLANGAIAPGFPAVHGPIRIGIGQSMGGGLAVVQQGRHHCYDGVAMLGFSAVHSHPPSPPGAPAIVVPWFPRDTIFKQPLAPLNRTAVERALADAPPDAAWQALAWGFFYDDVAPEVVEANLTHFDRMMVGAGAGASPAGNDAAWQTDATLEQITQASMTPGVVAAEAAAVTVPVLCAMGTRDFVPDPAGEARAFRSARSVDVFQCPRMGHMHNFAGTRALLWRRLELFGEWCAAVKGIG
jgi:alpha-beta hydrolase superfamily lysophospholipase